MKKFWLALALLVPTLASAEQVFFATDKSDLTFIEKEKLVTMAQVAKEDGSKIVIIGNADKRGSRAYNLQLGMRRAMTVLHTLMQLGVPEDQVAVALSYGEEFPMAPADSIKEHLAANRRVDILSLETKVVEVEVPVEVAVPVPTYRKNRVSLLGGAGPQGLNKDTLGTNHYKVSRDYEAVLGLGYSRNLNSRWSIGATAFTNASFFLNVGFDF